MGGSAGSDIKITLLRLPWAVLRFFGRAIRWFFVAVGVLAALAVLGYVEFESIIRMIDDRYADRHRQPPGHRSERDRATATIAPTSRSNRCS